MIDQEGGQSGGQRDDVDELGKKRLPGGASSREVL